MLVGYARVSTRPQNPALQIGALNAAACEPIFIEKASVAKRDWPELQAALDYIIRAVAECEREMTLEHTHAGLANARDLGRRGGRKPSMGEAEIKRARAMLADLTITVKEVAQLMGVRASTLYRHIPGGRSALQSEAV